MIILGRILTTRDYLIQVGQKLDDMKDYNERVHKDIIIRLDKLNSSVAKNTKFRYLFMGGIKTIGGTGVFVGVLAVLKKLFGGN